MLLSLDNGYIEELVPDEDLSELDEEIQKHMELGLPMLEKQQERIIAFKLKMKRNKALNQLTAEQRDWVFKFNSKEQDEILENLNQPP